MRSVLKVVLFVMHTFILFAVYIFILLVVHNSLV